ncbi:MAG: hypothetical protein K1X83_06200 [Oligoflexia bacterium]|nr:hypothetical protein [Oligoflexia bacterium]
MRYSSNALRHQLFVAAAVVAAHSTAGASGFRQKDVRFLVELFSNWVESSSSSGLIVQNTQVIRYLDSLIKEGYARRLPRDKPPTYRLTRTGLLELLARIIDPDNARTPEQFLFALFFIRNYRSKIQDLVIAEGTLFPRSLKIELDTLLDCRELLRREISRTHQQLKRLELRIEDNIKASERVSTGLRRGQPFEELVCEVEKLYPYELNSQKPLSELIHLIPAENRTWELTEGFKGRVDCIWRPMRKQLREYLETLQELERL